MNWFTNWFSNSNNSVNAAPTAVPTEPPKIVTPKEPTEPTKPVPPVPPAAPTKPTQPTQPTKPTEPTKPQGLDITRDMILHLAPTANKGFLDGLVLALNKYLPNYGITTELRIAHFLGQGAEESDGFRTLEEYASGKAYEGRADLGNVHPGDGVKYKGRGIFQITGRANYTKMSATLGADFISHPELIATPDNAVRTACEYWKSHTLNFYADQDDVLTITKKINGGTNGLADRKLYTARAKVLIKGLNAK